MDIAKRNYGNPFRIIISVFLGISVVFALIITSIYASDKGAEKILNNNNKFYDSLLASASKNEIQGVTNNVNETTETGETND